LTAGPSLSDSEVEVRGGGERVHAVRVARPGNAAGSAVDGVFGGML